VDEPAARRLSECYIVTAAWPRGTCLPATSTARPPARPQVVILSLADLLASNDKSR